MSGSEFRKLWRQFDMSGDGKINYTEFNNKVGYMILPYGSGLQMRRPETPKIKQWQEQAIAKAVQKKIKDIEGAFKEIDTDGSGRISHPEFIQALRKVGLPKIGDAESYSLMQKYRKPTNNTGEMTFEEFKACMTDYLKVPTSLDTARPPERASAALEIAESKIKGLPRDVDQICSYFKPFDPTGNGELHYDEFRKGLEAAGIKLTEAQFLSLCYKLDAIDDGIIAYRDFARYVVGEEKVAPKGGAAALDTFKHWVIHGVRPTIDLVTGRPMDREVAVRRAANKTGLSEVEIRMAHALLGRRNDLRAAFMRYDSSGTGEMSQRDFIHMLEALDVPYNKDLIETLIQKYDLNRNGDLDYPEFEKWMGPLMELTDGNLRRLYLERMSAEEAAAAQKEYGIIPAVSSSSSITGKPPAGGAMAAVRAQTASATNRKGISASNKNDDAMSIATANMDLDPIAQKMRRVLGKHWMNVAKDIHHKAEREVIRTGGSTTGLDKSGVSASVVRDALAEKGVPLTSKEIRAISLKYHGNGIPSTRNLDGIIDVDKAFTSLVGTGHSSSRPPRPSTASATMRR